MSEEFFSSRRRRRSLHELHRFYCGSTKSSQTSQTETNNVVNDSRKAVGDQGILIEGSQIDASDNSVTNITTADPEIVARAFDATEAVVERALDSADTQNLRAYEFAREANSDALAVAADTFDAAAKTVAADAAASREFAGDLVNQVIASAKSADERNVETITKALTVVAIAGAGVLALRSIKK